MGIGFNYQSILVLDIDLLTLDSNQLSSENKRKSTMSSKPDFVIVPGAWHSPNSFAPTTTLLTKAGYNVHGVHLPSYGANPPLKSFDPDVLAVKDVVNKVLSTGKDVVMIFHSYGGVVGCEALSHVCIHPYSCAVEDYPKYLHTLRERQRYS